MASIAAIESIGKAWKHPQTGEIRYYIEAEKVTEMAGISGEAYGRGERSLSKSQFGQLKACRFWLTADGELHIKGTLPTTCIDGMRTAEDLIREAVAEAIADDEPEVEEVTEEQEVEEECEVERILMVEDRYSDTYGPFASMRDAKRKALELLDACSDADLERRTGGRQIMICEYRDEVGMDVDEILDVVEQSDRLRQKPRKASKRTQEVE